MRFPRKNRGTWLTAGVLVIAAIVVAVIAGITLTGSNTPNKYNPKVGGFTTATTPPPTTKGKRARFLWPIYGFNDQRTRVFSGPAYFNDPANLKQKWALPGNGPLEFPPDIYGNALFVMDDNASVSKINATTGRRYWRKRVGMLSAASPALDVKLDTLFVPVLSDTSNARNSRGGSFVAVSMKKPKILWRIPVPSGSETSPLVWGDNVYFGDQGGTEYDVNAKTGHLIWSFPTSGAIKGGATLEHGVLFFGNYAGAVYAVKATSGHQVWETNIGPNVYASPTVADGRIFVGNTGGGFYSLSERSGQVAWSMNTGNYVYSSAAVVNNTPRLGPTVFFGSYSGVAYAVNAQTSHVDWTANVGGSISGAASIVNNTVFFSSVYSGHNYTRGYDITSGKQVFSFPDGAYTATVASPKRVYLVGHYTLYGLAPAKR